MSATITTSIVWHIAGLANLPLTEEQVNRYAPQLNSVLEYTKQVQSLDTTGVPETNQVTGLENVLREDDVDEHRMFTQEEALANATATHNGMFVVPRLVHE